MHVCMYICPYIFEFSLCPYLCIYAGKYADLRRVYIYRYAHRENSNIYLCMYICIYAGMYAGLRRVFWIVLAGGKAMRTFMLLTTPSSSLCVYACMYVCKA